MTHMNERQRQGIIALGKTLSGLESENMAYSLDDGETIIRACDAVHASHRRQVFELLERIGFDLHSRDDGTLQRILLVLVGARSEENKTVPVWTAPLGYAQLGELNSSRDTLIARARTSIVCSTYNLTDTSVLWNAWKNASDRRGVDIRIYADAGVNEETDGAGRTMLERACREITGAVVFKTRRLEGNRACRNHAKFLSVDHQVLLVTSANFSYSAENLNIELGLKIEDSNLTEMVERQMREFETTLYERVLPRF